MYSKEWTQFKKDIEEMFSDYDYVGYDADFSREDAETGDIRIYDEGDEIIDIFFDGLDGQISVSVWPSTSFSNLVGHDPSMENQVPDGFDELCKKYGCKYDSMNKDDDGKWTFYFSNGNTCIKLAESIIRRMRNTRIRESRNRMRGQKEGLMNSKIFESVLKKTEVHDGQASKHLGESTGYGECPECGEKLVREKRIDGKTFCRSCGYAKPSLKEAEVRDDLYFVIEDLCEDFGIEDDEFEIKEFDSWNWKVSISYQDLSSMTDSMEIRDKLKAAGYRVGSIKYKNMATEFIVTKPRKRGLSESASDGKVTAVLVCPTAWLEGGRAYIDSNLSCGNNGCPALYYNQFVPDEGCEIKRKASVYKLLNGKAAYEYDSIEEILDLLDAELVSRKDGIPVEGYSYYSTTGKPDEQPGVTVAEIRISSSALDKCTKYGRLGHCRSNAEVMYEVSDILDQSAGKTLKESYEDGFWDGTEPEMQDHPFYSAAEAQEESEAEYEDYLMRDYSFTDGIKGFIKARMARGFTAEEAEQEWKNIEWTKNHRSEIDW